MGDSKMGVENYKALVLGVAEMSSGVAAIAEDGIGVGDIKHVPKLFSSIRSLSNVQLGMLLAEANDFDENEKAELAALFMEKFDLPSDSIEATIEAGLPIVLEGLQAVLSLLKLSSLVKK